MMTQKINEEFYPLTSAIARKLRETKLTAAEWRIWSYLTEVDPWGDRYQNLDTLTLLSECEVSKATFYRAISKLQELDLFDFQDKGFSVRNRNGIAKLRQPDSLNQETDSERLRKGYRKNETTFSEMRQLSQNCDNSLNNETTFSEMRQLSQNCKNQPLETLQGKHPTTPQTLQTDQTPQTGGGDQKKMTGLEEILSKEIIASSVPEKESVPRVVQNTTKSSKGNPPVVALTPEMSARLEAFGIPLDGAVRKAIATHHPSQIWGAIRHIENTWETVENPRAIFLYQVPKQPIEKPLKDPLTPQFLEWYKSAIALKTVKDISPEILPINQFREPKVYLPDDRLEDWQKVAAGECEELANSEQMADFFKKAAQLRGTKQSGGIEKCSR